MCGRIASNITGAEQLIQQFFLRGLAMDIAPRFNIAPSQQALVITQDEQGARQATYLRWGFIPAWAKDESIGVKMINARSETVAEKPAFRTALRRRRCVIPASGFYEWQRADGKKTPFYFYLRSGQLLALAGLWEQWLTPEKMVTSFTILTTEANALVSPIHHRMPVLLNREDVEVWLNHASYDQRLLTSLLVPYPADEMETYPVSAYVNSPANEGPQCIEPMAG